MTTTETSTLVTRAGERRQRRSPARGGRGRSPFRGGWYVVLFLGPLLLFYGVYFLYSFGILGMVSTERVGLTFRNAVDVGMQNFVLVLEDPTFQRSLINTIVFGLFSVLVALTLGFILAMMLASGVRMRRLFYTVFLLPSLIPMSLFATVFSRMLETRDGAINDGLRNLGLGFLAQDWLGDPTAAYVAIGILLTYTIGLPIMYYTTDVAQVNASIVESATLDGASVWQIYRIMLFPLLRTTHITVILSVILGSFRAFDIIYFSTGGQPGGRTDITGTYIYKATLGLDRVGYAAAASIIVLIIALIISVVQIIVRRKAS
ncbi:carbohydrate ABC transporter permease [Agromyces sp. Root1464]|uniref:carbohydrate ABC transporter permease n=1 Tax=Agromyces sp. Root1464 TaxID=1736467 RepID=UPI000ADFAAEE|nr:sugar ABC transporter permease [Agromyces sp. Root1464]